MVAPYDWKLLDGGNVQPDMMVIRREDFDPDGPFPVSAAPVLVVEVLSPSNPAQDQMLKRDLYPRLGVPACWIVDPSGTLHTDWPLPLDLTLTDLAE